MQTMNTIQTKINVSRVRIAIVKRTLGESHKLQLTHRFSGLGEAGFNDTSLVTAFRDEAATVFFFCTAQKTVACCVRRYRVGEKLKNE